jgi:hypothetical protein
MIHKPTSLSRRKKMRKDVKQAWVKELQMTTVRQIRGSLGKVSMGHTVAGAGNCCLGVLCTVLERQFPEILEESGVKIDISNEGEMYLSCPSTSENTLLFGNIDTKLWHMLEPNESQNVYWQMNDCQGMSFHDIADKIKEYE